MFYIIITKQNFFNKYTWVRTVPCEFTLEALYDRFPAERLHRFCAQGNCFKSYFFPSPWVLGRYKFIFVQCYIWGCRVRGNGLKAICNCPYCFHTKTHIWSKPDLYGVRPAIYFFYFTCVIKDFLYTFGGIQSVETLDKTTLDGIFKLSITI